MYFFSSNQSKNILNFHDHKNHSHKFLDKPRLSSTKPSSNLCESVQKKFNFRFFTSLSSIPLLDLGPTIRERSFSKTEISPIFFAKKRIGPALELSKKSKNRKNVEHFEFFSTMNTTAMAEQTGNNPILPNPTKTEEINSSDIKKENCNISRQDENLSKK